MRGIATASLQGIIIRTIPYKDHIQIVKVFTEHHGLMSFSVRLSKSKTGIQRHVCQVMNLVEIEANIKEESDLQTARNMRLATPLATIPFDPSKSAMILYLGELLSKTLPDQYHNKPLFKFLFDAVLLLDDSMHIQNFHLWATLEVIRHYGFYPTQPQIAQPTVFDLLENEFRRDRPLHPFFLEKEETALVLDLIDKDWSAAQFIAANGTARKNVLNGLLQMVNLQLELKVSYKSLDVLHQVFHD